MKMTPGFTRLMPIAAIVAAAVACADRADAGLNVHDSLALTAASNSGLYGYSSHDVTGSYSLDTAHGQHNSMSWGPGGIWMDFSLDAGNTFGLVAVVDVSYFSVEETWDVSLDWDISEAHAPIGFGGGWGLYDITNRAWVHNWHTDGDAGSQLVTLEAGVEYKLLLDTFISGADGGSASLHIEKIPAPGPVALLGMAGLICTRRRRRRC